MTHPATSPQPPRDALASKLKRTEIQHSPSSIPGRDIVQVLTEIPVGVESGWHTHPGEEVGYIVAGTVEMAIHGRATLTLQAGDGFLIPPRTPHNARDIGPGTGHMLSTYIVLGSAPIIRKRPAASSRTSRSRTWSRQFSALSRLVPWTADSSERGWTVTRSW